MTITFLYDGKLATNSAQNSKQKIETVSMIYDILL